MWVFSHFWMVAHSYGKTTTKENLPYASPFLRILTFSKTCLFLFSQVLKFHILSKTCHSYLQDGQSIRHLLYLYHRTHMQTNFFHSYCVCVCVRVSAWTLIINPVHPKISERPESMESLVKQIPWNSNFRLIIYSKRRSVKVLIRCAFKIILMAMLQDGFEKGHQRTNLTVQSKE